MTIDDTPTTMSPRAPLLGRPRLTWSLWHAATSDNTSGRKSQAVWDLCTLPQLPLHVWRVVWSKLSPSQLVRAAGVCQEWRRQCIVKRWDEAVVEPGTIPDSVLRVPQQVLRGIQRILRQQSPFSGDPFSFCDAFIEKSGPKWCACRDDKGAHRFQIFHNILQPDSSFTAVYGVRGDVEDGKGDGVIKVQFLVSWKASSNYSSIVATQKCQAYISVP